MNRREFIALVGGAAAWPLTARAQQPERMRRIGVLMGLPANDPVGQSEVAGLQRGLRKLGWIVGRNVQIEYRWAGANIDRVQAFAKQLVALRRLALTVSRSNRAKDGQCGRESPVPRRLRGQAGTRTAP